MTGEHTIQQIWRVNMHLKNICFVNSSFPNNCAHIASKLFKLFLLIQVDLQVPTKCTN